MGFAGRAKGFAALADSSVSGQSTGSDIAMDAMGSSKEGRKLFADDINAIRSVVQAGGHWGYVYCGTRTSR